MVNKQGLFKLQLIANTNGCVQKVILNLLRFNKSFMFQTKCKNNYLFKNIR